MKSLITFGKSRLAQGTAVGFYGLAMQLVVQLLSVPVLTHSWGLAGYGAWVLLYSVPALLASTPGVSRNKSELRSFFSATIRFSRRYCATTGAGMPCSS